MAKFDPPYPNQLCSYFTGLTANPNSEAEPLRIQAEQFQSLYPGGDFLVWTWDKDGWWSKNDAIQECQDWLKVYRAGNSRGTYTSVLLAQHSYGGAFGIFLCDWLLANAPDVVINFAAFYDPVSNAIFAGGWTIGSNVLSAMQFTQNNGLGWFFPLGPNGTPLPAGPNIVSTNFPLGTPNMDHLKIIAACWPQTMKAMQGAIR